jgi:hypothetical protein
VHGANLAVPARRRRRVASATIKARARASAWTSRRVALRDLGFWAGREREGRGKGGVSAEVEPWTGREGGGDGKRSCEGKAGALRARVYLFAVLFLFFFGRLQSVLKKC